jgi:peptide/nickel transport system permease protein
MPRSLVLVRRRLIQAVPVLATVVIAVFVVLALAPGDAVDAYLAATGGGDAGLAQQLRDEWGLTGSVLARLLAYLQGLAQFDLGYSVSFSRPVAEVIGDRIVNTLLLSVSGLAVATVLGAALGAVAALKPGSPRDLLSTGIALVFNATPGFWLALMLIVLFAVKLAWFPLSGIASLTPPEQPILRVLDIAWHLVLPVSVLGLTYLAIYQRLMRAAMLRVTASDYVRTARAKGLSPARIVWRHIVRNAVLPVVTMLGVQAGNLLGGSVVIESVFAIPGLGRLAYEAVLHRDVPLMVGILLCSALLVTAANLAIDLAYGWLDPRIES